MGEVVRPKESETDDKRSDLSADLANIAKTNSPETSTNPQSLSDEVFDSIYARLSSISRDRTAKKAMRSGKTDVDPARDFVKDFYDKADRTKSNLNEANGLDIIEGYLASLHQSASSDTYDRGQRLLREEYDHISDLVKSGQVDKLTAQIFINSLPSMKLGLSSEYNSIVKRENRPERSASLDHEYDQFIRALYKDDSNDIVEQESGGFIHFNTRREAVKNQVTTDRVYISGEPESDSAKLVKTWMETLKQHGLDKTIYFKIPDSRDSHRYEQIVVYKSAENGQAIDEAVKIFIENCPSELLSHEPMPSVVKITNGVYLAPEPAHVNKLLRYATRNGDSFDKISYNEFIAVMYELSMRRATMDMDQKDGVKPRQIRELARDKYFKQFLNLSGIDPTTMKSFQ